MDGAIKADVLRMHHHLSTWQRVTDVIADNRELPDSYWWEFMFETYAITQASAVRRQADTRRDANSLMRLIMDVRKGASAVTRAWWLDTLWKPSQPIERIVAESQWNTHFGGTVGQHLDPAIPDADTEDLTTAAANVKRYVDEHIAHTSAAPVEASVTLQLEDVHDAMETVDRLFRRYHGLFTASTFITTTPVEQDDFHAVFRVPWARPGYTPKS